MAEIIITVDYNPEGPKPHITVDKPEVHIAPGTAPTIQWVLGTAPSATTIFGIGEWDPRDPLNHDPSVENAFTGTDDNMDPPLSQQRFNYVVTLMHNDAIVPKDPEIVNDPGTGHFIHDPKST